MAITHTDADNIPIPITSLNSNAIGPPYNDTYSREIQVWLEENPIRVIDRRLVTAI